MYVCMDGWMDGCKYVCMYVCSCVCVNKTSVYVQSVFSGVETDCLFGFGWSYSTRFMGIIGTAGAV